jgi:DNA modification methylase
MKNLDRTTGNGIGSEAVVPFTKHTQSALVEVADLGAQASYGIALQPSRTKVHGTIHCGDVIEVLKSLPSETVHCCVTSPPYFGLRDYGVNGQIGLEETPEEYVERLVSVFREVRRVLRVDGTLWVNIGDSYAGSGKGRNRDGTHRIVGGIQGANRGTMMGHLRKTQGGPGVKPKDLIGIPWMLAFALRADGWYLRSEIIWHKPNPMPESVTDRPTKAHEQMFLLSKSQHYYYDAAAIREPNQTKPHCLGASKQAVQFGAIRNSGSDAALRQPSRVWAPAGGRNKRSVWTITPKPFKDAHFATFPPELPETCLLAGSAEGGVVLDPFSGAATTGIVAVKNGRSYQGVELNPEYVKISERRFQRELGITVDCADFRGRQESIVDAPVEPEKTKLVRRTCRCAFAVQTICLGTDSELELHDEGELPQMAEELAA